MKRTGLIIAICLLMAGCIPEEGNPDLAGAWSCKETSEIFLKGAKGTSIYQVTYLKDALSSDKYYIDNIYKLGSGIKVSVIRNGYSITLPRQTADNIVFEGSGTINDTYDLITMTYTADDGGGQIDHVTAEYSR